LDGGQAPAKARREGGGEREGAVCTSASILPPQVGGLRVADLFFEYDVAVIGGGGFAGVVGVSHDGYA
jgi:hypothetical protein